MCIIHAVVGTGYLVLALVCALVAHGRAAAFGVVAAVSYLAAISVVTVLAVAAAVAFGVSGTLSGTSSACGKWARVMWRRRRLAVRAIDPRAWPAMWRRVWADGVVGLVDELERRGPAAAAAPVGRRKMPVPSL